MVGSIVAAAWSKPSWSSIPSRLAIRLADSRDKSLSVDPLDSIQASIRSSQSCPGDHFQVAVLVSSLESEPSARHSAGPIGPMAPRAIHPQRIHLKGRDLSLNLTRWIFKTGSVSSKVGVV
jgi:hypothetical protein